MFIAALFTTAKLWNQSRCSSTDQMMGKMDENGNNHAK
jgi:hypothetical protein